MSVDQRMQARDRGIRRVSRATGVAIGGGIVVAAGVAGLAANAAAQTRQASPSSTVTVPATVAPITSDADDGVQIAPLTPPATPPQPSDRPPRQPTASGGTSSNQGGGHVVSGGT